MADPAPSLVQPVAEDVWQFRIGGYQMAHKWLKDRRGRVLDVGEINDYISLLTIQSETIRLMQRVESVALQCGMFQIG